MAWGKVGKIVGEYVTKGRLVYVEGRLHTSSWADEQSREKRSRTEVVAQEVILLDSRRADEGTDDTDEAEPEPTAPARRQHTPQQPQGTQGQQAAPRRRAAAPKGDDWGDVGL